VRNALELILTESDLNVRILTRSPLAKKDFDLYKKFADQNRILFGMSIPTLDDTLRKIYEPGAPAPEKKMETLVEAVAEGIPVYVALAPTLPDEGEKELRNILERIKSLKPVTIFHEPINLRAENLSRIETQAKSLGRTIRGDVFKSHARWREYAFHQCALVDKIALDLKIPDGVLHQWPDKALSSKSGFMEMKRMQAERQFKTRSLSTKQLEEAEKEWSQEKFPWLQYWHNPSERISAWPPRVNSWK
jgi:DNA repair photolyase